MPGQTEMFVVVFPSWCNYSSKHDPLNVTSGGVVGFAVLSWMLTLHIQTQGSDMTPERFFDIHNRSEDVPGIIPVLQSVEMSTYFISLS